MGYENSATAMRGLRRAHWRALLAAVVLSGLALAVLATLVVRADAHERQVRLDAAMMTRAKAGAALVYFESGQLKVADLARDAVGSGSPQLVVLGGLHPARKVFAGAHPGRRVDVGELLGTARRATVAGEVVRGAARDVQDRPVRLLAVPFYNNAGEPAGAVIAIGVPTDAAAGHRKLIIGLGLCCLGLLLLIATAGHLLGGRNLRSATSVLGQQDRFLTEVAERLHKPVASDGCSERTLETVTDLLLRARVVAGTYRAVRVPLRLDELVASTVDAIRVKLGCPETLELRVVPCTVRADAQLVKRAVTHLVENAFVHGRAEDNTVRVTVHGDGRVTVADNGQGLPAAVSAALDQDPAERATTLGLGLSLAECTARVHGRRLVASRGVGGGAVLVLAFTPECAGLADSPS